MSTDAARIAAHELVIAWRDAHYKTVGRLSRQAYLALIDAIAAALGERDAALTDLRERCAEAAEKLIDYDGNQQGLLSAAIIRALPLRRGDPRG